MFRTRRLLLVVIALFLLALPSAAKDQWTQVRSKNFFLIGNASEKDIRKVGTRLEQFRESFRILFKGLNLVAPIGTNVIVFKSDSSYKPFKPKRADGKTDEFVAGYFQPGRDVNYITISTEGEDGDMFRTIFHEYVHFIIDTTFGRADVPPWLNEGLAEYFETYAIEGDQKIKLGLANSNHVLLLRQNKMMSLSQLLGVGHSQLLNTGDHSRSIFYAQSWALIHYLMQNGKSSGISRYINEREKNTPPDAAFKLAFQVDYPAMEKQLQDYVGKNTFQYGEITLKEKLTFEAAMQASPLDEAASNAYLGDLLAHTRRADDAEVYFGNALRIDPNSSIANTGMGMVKLDQRKFGEARTYLEKAIQSDAKNAFALYRYATLLSREGQDEFGITRELSKDTVAKIRDALMKAVVANPSFTESYELLAYVNLAGGGDLDEAALAIKKALEYQPGNQRYLLRLAEIYLRKDNFNEARAIVAKMAANAGDGEVAASAERLAQDIARREDYTKQRAVWEERQKAGGGFIVGPRTDPAMTSEEIDKANAQAVLRSINRDLRVPRTGETRVIGIVEKIDCRKRPIAYRIKTPAGPVVLTSVDFQVIDLLNYAADAGDVELSCDANISAFNALITFKASGTKPDAQGELTAIEFVPKNFRLMSANELAEKPPRLVRADEVDETGAALPPTLTKRPSQEDLEKMQRDAILKGMRGALRQPGEGEKREMGYLDKIECSDKGEFFIFRTSSATLRLINRLQQGLQIRVFTPDLSGVGFGCASKPVEYPVVFVYKVAADAKLKTQGEIVALDFVPKSFVLE